MYLSIKFPYGELVKCLNFGIRKPFRKIAIFWSWKFENVRLDSHAEWIGFCSNVAFTVIALELHQWQNSGFSCYQIITSVITNFLLSVFGKT